MTKNEIVSYLGTLQKTNELFNMYEFRPLEEVEEFYTDLCRIPFKDLSRNQIHNLLKLVWETETMLLEIYELNNLNKELPDIKAYA